MHRGDIIECAQNRLSPAPDIACSRVRLRAGPLNIKRSRAIGRHLRGDGA